MNKQAWLSSSRQPQSSLDPTEGGCDPPRWRCKCLSTARGTNK